MQYRNYLEEIGITQAQADKRVQDDFMALVSDPKVGVWHDVDADSACFVDTGNLDARTEGMSYGMMMCVQMDRQDLFDKLWRFSVRYMRQTSGKYAGYFAWSVGLDGKHNAEGPAPDGEEYFAMALFMADARWESEEFDYAAEARDILRHCLHQPELCPGGRAMWDAGNHLIRFVPEADYSDPSYHLPHFYEYFARKADPVDRPFWRQAARASREYIALSADLRTGMCAEYAEYDGAPRLMFNKPYAFYSDAYRVCMNIALDALWCGEHPALSLIATRFQDWMDAHEECNVYACNLDGTTHEEQTMHPVGLLATTAAASIASHSEHRVEWMKYLWDVPLCSGKRRYYDNCLMFFSLLMLSGNYKMY